MDYKVGDINVDGFSLTSVIEFDGKKWNKIANCDSGEGDEALLKDIKNAKLFAASPELLEALQLALPYIQEAYVGAFPDDEKNNEILEKAKIAIAKTQ